MTHEEILAHLRQLPDILVPEDATGCPDLTVNVPPESLKSVALACREDAALGFDTLSCLSAVDGGDRIEVVYHLTSIAHKHRLVLKATLDRTDPEIDSVSEVWSTANWYERECFDLLGVRFRGHPDLRRLLMPDDWQGYPLRKDDVPPAEYHGMSTSREDPLKTPSAPATEDAQTS